MGVIRGDWDDGVELNPIDADALRVLYHNERMTQVQIARYFDCSPARVLRHMRCYGIKARNRSLARPENVGDPNIKR